MLLVQQCVKRALGEVLRRQPLSAAKVRFAWQTTVGTAMARATSVRVRADGTLDVHANTEHWRHETTRSANVIQTRLSELLGGDVVKRVVVSDSWRIPEQ